MSKCSSKCKIMSPSVDSGEVCCTLLSFLPRVTKKRVENGIVIELVTYNLFA